MAWIFVHPRRDIAFLRQQSCLFIRLNAQQMATQASDSYLKAKLPTLHGILELLFTPLKEFVVHYRITVPTQSK